MMIIHALIVVFFLIGAMAAPLCAQTYPSKPIHLIMPFPTGGGTDIVGRIMAQKIGERLGQLVVIDNRPGAGGNIAYEIAAKARPDGYTLILGASSLSISPSLYKKLNYNPIKDLAPISLVAQVPNRLAAVRLCGLS
ncbi:MAG: hypothetical protein L7F78_19260 [Syntrophales bacterium LBB04]|nr:hypothetical protein [Syntrophales bacterium LBB04]